MKLTSSLAMIGKASLEQSLSKKIMFANTSDKQKQTKGFAQPSDPLYFNNSSRVTFNPDIRYSENYGYAPYQTIDGRNALLLFAENIEIKKILEVITNEIAVAESSQVKYSVFPEINLTTLGADKQELGKILQKYIDEIFYPQLYRMLKLNKKDGLSKLASEYLTTGKLAFEIRYDNINKPKEIEDIVPIDPATLQKTKIDGQVWFIQQLLEGNQRILHDNQVILIEYNEYDFGYVSYVDSLRRPYNIMRSMQNAKIMWFAVKSQVRMHINFAFGDVPRKDAMQKLSEAKEDFINTFEIDDNSGKIFFNGSPDSTGYHEYFTAETANSGKPDIEEVNTNGPDLTEVDSLQYWEKLFYRSSDVPYDRIDPNNNDSFSFIDVTNIRNIEKQFGKRIQSHRDKLEELILKPLIIQLTIKETEIGVDLSLLDSIKAEWVTINEYEDLANMELINKKLELANNIAIFGERENADGAMVKLIPLKWIVKNYLDYSAEQLASMEVERKQENIELGFDPGGTGGGMSAMIDDEEDFQDWGEISEDDDADGISAADDDNY